MKVALVLGLPFCVAAQGTNYVNGLPPWHPARLDTQGRLLAWFEAEKNLGYDQVLRLGWDFIENRVPADTRHGTGLKVYLVDSTYDGQTLQGRNWQHNPAITAK
jgi:hypothetical protein